MKTQQWPDDPIKAFAWSPDVQDVTKRKKPYELDQQALILMILRSIEQRLDAIEAKLGVVDEVKQFPIVNSPQANEWADMDGL